MRIVWLPRALKQLLAIAEYIGEDSPEAAVALAQTIRERADTLAAYPLRCRTGRVAGTREMVVKPNYLVIYRVAGDEVQILRVRHARQRGR
ncbi:type II toxin-antitoxin system mRNA interferase toxin, RelE/StbE family [Burkholderia ubonensis]|uniref:type II toxin-antitoxin system RelE/ParE family toxin n=1 Tax=Burkholderia ubonensis TaxID=101571 RepID=UPI000751BA3D|nr:type II toxin-antitoxin system mRNA interferase toxin, RelE/StbE family [Burkholderia ubonensis]KVW81388.1 addiction module antitoxin [Burkholderia ubonensis]